MKEGFYWVKHNGRTLQFSNSNSILQLLPLLDDFAEEGEDEEREDGAPDEGVEDHERPPEDTLGGGAESVGDGVAGLAEEAALEEQEEDEVDDAERDVCEEEGFHRFSWSLELELESGGLGVRGQESGVRGQEAGVSK